MLGREKTVVRGNKDESDLVQGTGIGLSETRSMGSLAEGRDRGTTRAEPSPCGM